MAPGRGESVAVPDPTHPVNAPVVPVVPVAPALQQPDAKQGMGVDDRLGSDVGHEPYTGFGDLTQPLAPLLTEPPKPVHAPAQQRAAPVAGRYRLEGLLGSGGAGSVWTAYDPVLARPVAVKTLPLSLLPDTPSTRDTRDRLDQRFLAEARLAAKLEHAYIVSVFDAGVDPEPGGHGAYIVMSLLRGKDLKRLLAGGWRPTAREACRLLQRVSEALAYAHALGVVHRDIKPANIVLVGRARPVVLDFGLAHQALAQSLDPSPGQSQPPGEVRAADESQEAKGVHTGDTAGSPYYAAPEQFEGQAGDRRSDLYAAGVLLYELLTGQRPYAGQTLSEIRSAVLAGRAPPPSRFNPEVDSALDTIVLRAMARQPEARHANAADLARELRHWRLSQRAAAVPRRRGLAGWLSQWTERRADEAATDAPTDR